MPAFEDSDFGVEPQRPQTPILSHLQKIVSNGSPSKYSHNLSVPSDRQNGTNGTIEVPATRSSIAESQALMHSLSMSPSQVDRRGSRNSFGAHSPFHVQRDNLASPQSQPQMADQPGLACLRFNRLVTFFHPKSKICHQSRQLLPKTWYLHSTSMEF